jgi:hypothetical protein
MKNFLSNQHSIWRKIAGIGFLVLGMSIAVLLLISAYADFPLWVLGKIRGGVVEEKWYELIEENDVGELSFNYFVSYSFSTPEGKTFKGSSQLSAQEWSALVEGGEVMVVYNQFNPSNNRIDDSRFRPLLICSYLPLIFLAWLLLTQGWEIITSEFFVSRPELWRLEKKEG